MVELNLYPIVGFFNELYEPDLKSLSLDPLVPNGRWSLRRANGLFWAQHLSKSKLESLIDRVQASFRYTMCDVPQYATVIENPALFIEKVIKSPIVLANQGSSKQSFFSAIETLTILCKLYSDFIYSPFRLTVEEGFLLNEFSSKHLVEQCLNPSTNPYFDFIVENCWPVIEAIKPDLIWMLGPVRFSTFTMAMLAKKAFPNVHISVVGHSSEYYSLNKIAKYLKSNELLFSVIDSIVLDDTEHTQSRVARCVKSGDSLDSVPNLLYIDRDRKEIKKTRFETSQKSVSNWVSRRPRSFPQDEELQGLIDPSEIVNVKLWPDAKCYWNRCTFCGINHKYHTLPELNVFEDVDEKAEFVSQLADAGCRYFWLIDEAVPPEILEKLAHSLLQHDVRVYWQARSRIDKGFSQRVCSILAEAGLREIRLGLESANHRILKLMNKFPKDFDLDLVEQIVSRFHQSGVSVHFPIIVGFPTETFQERLETFDFLRDLKKKYTSVTFNINSLGLDVASPLYKYYEAFDITSLKWPCPSRYYLGNLLDWDSDIEHFDRNAIDVQRNSFMRQILYPWMPRTAMTPAYILYRLSETSRVTLVWKTGMFEEPDGRNPSLLPDSKVRTAPNLVHSRLDRTKNGAEALYRVYDWDSHNYLECNEDGLRLLEVFREPYIVKEGLEIFRDQFYRDSLSPEQVVAQYLPQLQVAYSQKFLCSM